MEIVGAKKILMSMIRAVYYTLRKEISKRKLLIDLNLMMKRGKIASKTLANLITLFHHHHHHHNHRSKQHDHMCCKSSPAFPFQLHKRRTNNNHHGYNSHFFACAHPPIIEHEDEYESSIGNHEQMLASGEASPVLPSRSGMVRQLRVTDSPFPLNNTTTINDDDDDDDDHRVDYAAEVFIAKFYSDLKNEQLLTSPTPW